MNLKLEWFKNGLAKLRSTKLPWRKALPGVLCATFMGTFYLSGKFQDGERREVASGKPAGDFRPLRAFDSSIAALSAAKDARLAKVTHEYTDAMKVMKDDIEKVKAEVRECRLGHGAPTAASAPQLPGSEKPAVTAPGPGSDVRPGAPEPKANADLVNGGLSGSPEPPLPSVQAPGAAAGGFSAGRRSGLPPVSAYGVRPIRTVGLPRRGPPTVSFPVKAEADERLQVTLPAGAFVKARMLTGVAAPEGRPYPVLLSLDFAHVLPNWHRLDLSGCFMIAKAQGDLSTERLQMQATKMSCVGRDGRMFEREVSAFVADDKDNNFAVSGEVQSKQDRVAVMAFLASVVEGVGKAIQQAQTREQVTPMGGSQTVISGDQQKYLAAGGASDAAGQVAAWYLKEAENLLPTINVNSGREVWAVMQESVSLPSSYFKRTGKGEEKGDSYSYVTRLLE